MQYYVNLTINAFIAIAVNAGKIMVANVGLSYYLGIDN
jgi:hypothetical protein